MSSILDLEENKKPLHFMLKKGATGAILGGIVGLGCYSFIKKKYPKSFQRFNSSIKTSIILAPSVLLTAFFSEKSISNYITNPSKVEKKKAVSSDFSQKAINTFHNNKFLIFISSWLGFCSLFWVVSKRNKKLTKDQVMYQTRIFAQIFTIVSLVGIFGIDLKLSKKKENNENFENTF